MFSALSRGRARHGNGWRFSTKDTTEWLLPVVMMAKQHKGRRDFFAYHCHRVAAAVDKTSKPRLISTFDIPKRLYLGQSHR